MRKRALKMGLSGSSIFGRYSCGSLIRYYCMSCGLRHNQASCPGCCSKMKRVVFVKFNYLWTTKVKTKFFLVL